jgi:hypothetical protein
MTMQPVRSLPRYLSGLALLAGCVMPLAAHAADLTFLAKSPVSYFKQDDVDLMMKNARAALDADSTARQGWSNPKSGASGFAQVRGQFTAADGTPCKQLRVENKIRNVESDATYTVCKYPDRGWVINADAQPAR